MKVKNTLAFNGQFEAAEEFNSTMLRTKMKIFAFGENRNGSSINLDTFTKASKSLKHIPVVAKYNAEEDDLEGHNVELKVENGEYELYHNTSPFGMVGSDANITFEEVNEGTETNPNIKTYVVVDNVYLWKRYDATKRIESWLADGVVPKISMEIGSVEGKFTDNGYFQISSFEFEAIAALGSDIEPCFPRAEIETYSKQSFKEEYKSMVYELSEALNLNQQGGNEMTKEIKSTEQATPERTVLDMFTEAQFAEAHEMNEAFDSTSADKASTDINPDTPEDSEKDTEVEDETKVETEADDTESTVDDLEDDVVVTPEPETEEDEVVDFEAKFNELSTQHTSLQSEFATLQSQLSDLQDYKRQREESDIKAKFEGKLSDEEFEQVFTELKDSDLNQVEEKLFALIGKKNFAIQSTPKTNTNKVVLSVREEEESSDPYDALKAYLK